MFLLTEPSLVAPGYHDYVSAKTNDMSASNEIKWNIERFLIVIILSN